MKKVFLILVLMVGFAATSIAQDRVTYGIRAGLNLDHQLFIKDGITILPDNKLGFHVGFLTDIWLFNNFYFQPELLFTTKGSKTTQTGVGTTNYNLYYLELPILLAYVFPIQQSMGIRLHAGPMLAMGLGGKRTDPNGNKSSLFSSSRLRLFDSGLCFGGGLEIHQVYLGLSYDMGFYNVSQNKAYKASHGDIKNRTLKISVGYNF